ncbi:MAG: trypsin-like peptidase domain-containing protein [Candidatus Thiothrix putei]|uniref:Trypsin-like peptidase domain-containing protein n=1 Tax=Candidatus Thiothrix putei TaxID=3080811 RepID=A0AA95KK44_9GAMM|nr:MAG: trypsin-like peptidase domain-containing protein [Candidatus Thiothrix putei]
MPTLFRALYHSSRYLLTAVLLFITFPTMADEPPTQDILENSIVKIYVTSKAQTSYSPWNADSIASSGSGFIIEGKRILTNAHVVADHIFVEIQRDGTPKRYQATVEYVSHEMDIAVLKIKDETFFAKGNPLTLGELPDIHQEIMVHGFPIGGDTLSTTRGIVSRIEYMPYVHSGLSYQAIQIDAAINPGNSGGPAIINGKVAGMVMQKSDESAENIGYIIPTVMINRFLTDIADGKYDGFPSFSVEIQNLLSPTLKQKYQLNEEQSGVLISKVCANTSAEKVLQENDVITHIDGKNIDDDGTALLTQRKTINFQHYLDLHQVGDTLTLDIVRNGKPQQVKLLLDKADESDYTYDKEPRYVIYGGFVFVASDVYEGCQTREDYDERKDKDKKDDISITQVLAASGNLGFHDLSSLSIKKLNGERFNTFEEFYKRLRSSTTPFIILEDYSGYEVAIDRKLADSEHDDIMEQYSIHKDRSKDVAAWDKELAQQ